MSDIRIVSTTTTDGDLLDISAIKTYCATHTIDVSRLVVPVFQHGTACAVVEKPSKKVLLVDAVMTREKGLVLGLRVADCLPIVVYDSKHQVLSTIHGSWRTLMQSIVPLTLLKMGAVFETDPQDCAVWIGPSIQKCCNVVEKDCPLSTLFPWKPFLHLDEKEKDRVRIDLQGFCIEQLCSLGVPSKKICNESVCTFHNPEYFSHRRSIMTNNPKDDGRMAVFAWIPQ